MDNVIVKTLQLSTAHISRETAKWIERCLEEFDVPDLIIYEKQTYGWFILVPNPVDSPERLSDVPDDLRRVIEYAIKHECYWVVLDCDADCTSELPEFEWLE